MPPRRSQSNNRLQDAPPVGDCPEIADAVQAPELHARNLGDRKSGTERLDIHAGLDLKAGSLVEIHGRKDMPPKGVISVTQVRESPSKPPAHQLQQSPVAQVPVPLHIVGPAALGKAGSLDEVGAGE